MSKPKRRAQSGARAKKKIWVPILSPKVFNEQVIGETPVIEVSKVVGKILKSNMMTLTGNIRKQSINTKLEITEVKEGKARSKLIRYEISPPAIKRLVRRRRDRIDDSLVYQTKDGVKVRVKPFVLTRNLTKGSVRTEIRKRIKVFLFKTISQISYDEMVRNMISNKLQKDMRENISKLYPIRNTEIRVMHIEKNDARISPSPVIRERPLEVKEEAPEEEKKSEKEKPKISNSKNEEKSKAASAGKVEKEVKKQEKKETSKKKK